MSDKAELQRIARLVEVNRQRLQQVEEQLTQLLTVKQEHEETEQTLLALQQQGAKMIPLSSGVHLPSSETDKVVVDLGSNIFGERSIESAIEIMHSRQQDLTAVIVEINEQKLATEERIQELVKAFQESTPEQTSEEAPLIEDEQTKPQNPRRRRGFGSELTLDD
ncbi:MAG TPA: prefoldin subunit alpha [Candidatus Poseidoniales archaeon]|jgi:prefoldin alpha subunit|nr:MAG: prefoldin subunit alpha [Euryarchaeota archaeon]HIF15757.1 prefoldin subunit alpha [Candidatus Poseidoniales archaeon]